ncbi:hypothetical protein HK405_011265, partial [Cladochytrium tenue]
MPGGRGGKGASVGVGVGVGGGLVDFVDDGEGELSRLVTRYVRDAGSRSHSNAAVLAAIKRACRPPPPAAASASHTTTAAVAAANSRARACARLLLGRHLRAANSAARLYALELIDELFARSHVFRLALLDDAPSFVRLAAGVPPGAAPLPPPAAHAARCRSYCCRLLSTWFERFGRAYKRSSLGEDAFAAELRAASGDSAAGPSETPYQREVLLRIYERCLEEIAENESTILEHLEKTQECIRILIPPIEGLRPEDEASTESVDLRAIGLASRSYRLVVSVPKVASAYVQETTENTVVFDALRESVRVLKAFASVSFPAWTTAIVKADAEDKARHEEALKKMIDLRRLTEDLVQKAEEILTPVAGPSASNATAIAAVGEADGFSADDGGYFDDDEDEEFVDVAPAELGSDDKPPRKRLRPSASVVTTVGGGMRGVFGQQADPQAVQDADGRSQRDKGKRPVYQAAEMIAAAPVVDFDQDLYYWDDHEARALLRSGGGDGLERSHRWFGSSSSTSAGADVAGDHDNAHSATLARLRTRTVALPPSHSSPADLDIPECRAPLRNGKLCSRRDIGRCPFHGPVIPRDAVGQPLDPALRSAEAAAAASAAANATPAWQLLEADVRANLGLEPTAGPAPTASTTATTTRRGGAARRGGRARRRVRGGAGGALAEELAEARARAHGPHARLAAAAARVAGGGGRGAADAAAADFNARIRDRKAFS